MPYKAFALRPYSPYSDLALEVHGHATTRTPAGLPGVRVHEERQGAATITRVEIVSEQGAEAMGKPVGNYITIDCPALRHGGRDVAHAVAALLERQVGLLAHLTAATEVLVVGLGNRNATPDALGPKVVDALLVTRHLREYVPPELKGQLRGVAALAPGVLGVTGLETGEVVAGVIEQVRPGLVICIDALAARSVARIGTTVQLSDTGIHPGAGIGNQRPALNQASLGVPVIAIGVPTVVHAVTIAHDAVDLLLQELRGRSDLADRLLLMHDQEKRQLIAGLLEPHVGDLVVTPKEIDDLVDDMSRIIAGALNAVLHAGIGTETLERYLN